MGLVEIYNNLLCLFLQQVKYLLALALILILSTNLFSEIVYVGGELDRDQIWTNDNTYVVFKDLIVTNNVMLTINQGVEVKIDFGRGIIIDKGIIRVSGTESDSVKFIPNYIDPGQSWKWKGIVVRAISDDSYFHFVRIEYARTALRIENCNDVTIDNSTITNCQLGVQFINSSSSLLQNCNIENNVDGIEISTINLGGSSNNTISNCIFKNINYNIYVFVEKETIYQNNLIANNLIGYGNNGLWIDDNDGLIVSNNIIEHNIILYNGAEFGYGLYLGQDSTIVANNIFWKNNIAVFSEQKGNNNTIYNNSFYQNTSAINILDGINGNQHFNNTFSLNTIVLKATAETMDVVFHNNNIVNTNHLENLVINTTNYNFFIPDNFWGTTDTSQINKLIFDKLDFDFLGEFNYNPFANSIDTSNPISPPYHVVKQIVGDQLHFSWHSNNEQDLRGYKLYFGEYNNYSFLENYDIGIDTTFVLPGDISINSQFAVTAFDSAITNNPQSSGHESPFAFAVIYPYAGRDTIICKNLQDFRIVNSNIPMEYDSLFWSTTGDGVFDDYNILNPIYIMGNLDYENGGVLISLNVVIEEDTIIDSFTLSFIDDPFVFAGNDTIVFPDMEINLFEARVRNFDSVMWFSSGDGSFDNSTLVNPVYYLGDNDFDSGIVILELTAYSKCGVVSDSVKITIEPYYTVTGKVWGSQKSANYGVVIAFKENDEGVRAMQIESTENNGTYKFERLMEGNYYMYALPDTGNFDNNVPGYYANKLRWQSAYLLPVYADVYDVDIHLLTPNFILPYGVASISGHMETQQAANFDNDIYCIPRFENSNNDFCYGGLSNQTVLLFDQTRTKLLDYTLTDELGNFYFNNLPYGNYIVDAERAGLLSIPSNSISLSPDHANETGLIIEINQKNLKIYFDYNVTDQFDVKVYPNPATNEINISYSIPSRLTSRLEIYDLFGNLVITSDIQTTIGSSLNKIDIINLYSGLYFGQIISLNQTIHFRFVKR